MGVFYQFPRVQSVASQEVESKERIVYIVHWKGLVM